MHRDLSAMHVQCNSVKTASHRLAWTQLIGPLYTKWLCFKWLCSEGCLAIVIVE